MYKIVLCIMSVLFVYLGYGQQRKTQIGSFKYFKEKGYSDERILAEYPNRVDADLKMIEQTTLDSLQRRMWIEFWREFDSNLPMKFKKSFYVFHEFCFDEAGHLDYFVYEIEKKVAKRPEMEEYVALLKQYVQQFDWVVATGTKWSQCGTWGYHRKNNPDLYD